MVVFLSFEIEIWNCFLLIGCGFGLIRYFKEHGWPSSTIFETPPENDEDRAKLIDTLQVLNLVIYDCLIAQKM